MADLMTMLTTNPLAKQLGVRPAGWEEATTPYGETGSFRSVADVVDGESLEKVLKAASSTGNDLSAGDFVRWCRQVLDLLDQVRVVVGRNDPVGAAAEKAVVAIRRGVVAAGSV